MTRTVKIFLSSPSDVMAEQETVIALTEEINDVIAHLSPERDVRLEVLRYQDDVYPDLGKPQDVVDRQIPRDFDIYLGIMWMRCGSPTGSEPSGTIHEFRQAMRRRGKTNRPVIMFYFSDERPPALARTPEELEQMHEVLKFRDELQRISLTRAYPDRVGFRERVRSGLLRAVADIQKQMPAAQAERLHEEAPITPVPDNIMKLAPAYDEARDTMRRVDAVVSAAASEDVEALRSACMAMIEQLPKASRSIDPAEALIVLRALRRHRRFAFMRSVANAFLEDGCREPEVIRHFAQALIEGGETMAAIRVLEGLVADPDILYYDWAEAKGALGRAWKDRAVRACGIRDDIAKEATRFSVGHYRDAWAKDNSLTYPGVNYVAIAAWDSGRALSVEERDDAKVAAAKIFATVEAIPEGKREAWDYASGGEALLGLGRYDEALKWYGEYGKREQSAFALAGTVRQLNQLWRATDHDWGQPILAPLIGKLGGLPGGSFSVPAKALEGLAKVSKVQHEAVLGGGGALSYSWLQDGFAMARSVAMIRKGNQPHGTGFVVRGTDLAEELGNGLFVVTNAHVVSDPPTDGAAKPSEASIRFELQGILGSYGVADIVWQSPPVDHDVSVLRLDKALPDGVEPLRFATELPALQDAKSRVFVIGHPQGREISFSFEDNLLLDYELKNVSGDLPCRVHYRTPTERGNSGSPVFDATWRVIAVHHAGGRKIPRLNGIREVYDANEGLWIGAIRRAIAKKLPPSKPTGKRKARR